MDRKLVLLIMAGGMLLLLVGFVSRQNSKTDFDEAREMIVMRQIAHSILQQTGDSSSPVSPVKRISENKFQLTFPVSFSFSPDSLVKSIDRIISKHDLPSNYIVQVSEAQNNKVVFGYAILGTEQQNIVPCRGRRQPALPYTIFISFRDKPFSPGTWLILGGVCLLIAAAVITLRSKRNRQTTTETETANNAINPSLQIGNYLFYPSVQRLVFAGEEIILTSKESKLLSIFAAEPNEIIDRNRLQKEVWEDEGVIVGRSLDVFVSKLRKRLEQDSAVKINSIHGKGYKLEIG
ncbi:winged helix family transcriptional regulator [Lacibacter luteus]|uniref:Winged helix family transcriptional regulator n=1 Tax=Lacibacter luteus TaxID=2508719 RepID=A0A4V1M7P0_9BACT|nr:winged helix-turn-helix domain-containing protein [Lacibacter luteus]RXK60745.1 winged helix family transcriptional regulator [Lacibacter luteus]